MPGKPKASEPGPVLRDRLVALRDRLEGEDRRTVEDAIEWCDRSIRRAEARAPLFDARGLPIATNSVPMPPVKPPRKPEDTNR